MAHADHVVAAVEGKGFGQTHAAGFRIQHQLHLAAVVEHARARTRGERGVVVRHRAGQAGLGQVEAVLGRIDVEQHLVLAGVLLVAVLQQFQAADHAAVGVDVGLDDVGGDRDDLGLNCGRGQRSTRRRARRTRSRQVVDLGLGGRRRHRLDGRLGREHRSTAVVHHPVVPQEHQGDGEHDPEDGTFIDFHWSYSGMPALAGGG
jgi:hypothetical protein